MRQLLVDLANEAIKAGLGGIPSKAPALFAALRHLSVLTPEIETETCRLCGDTFNVDDPVAYPSTFDENGKRKSWPFCSGQCVRDKYL